MGSYELDSDRVGLSAPDPETVRRMQSYTQALVDPLLTKFFNDSLLTRAEFYASRLKKDFDEVSPRILRDFCS